MSHRVAGFIKPCLPSLARTPPSGPDWLHEIKHDGYRMMVRQTGPGARLFTRRGYDWTSRYSADYGRGECHPSHVLPDRWGGRMLRRKRGRSAAIA
jgi:ATP-dependent DNA ligase